MKEDTNDPSRRPVEKGKAEMSEAEIDANVEDTFPASDPPGWTLGLDHSSSTSQERDNDDE